jgi:hypothetical protein
VGVGDHRPAGTILGLLIGVFFAWALVLAMKNQGITVFSLPVLSLVIVVLLAALVGVVVAILPSRQAAKLNILRDRQRVGRPGRRQRQMRPVVVEVVDIKRPRGKMYSATERTGAMRWLSPSSKLRTRWPGYRSSPAWHMCCMRVPPSAPTAAGPWRARS